MKYQLIGKTIEEQVQDYKIEQMIIKKRLLELESLLSSLDKKSYEYSMYKSEYLKLKKQVYKPSMFQYEIFDY